MDLYWCLPAPGGWRAFLGRDLTLGVRPEAVRVGGAGDARLSLEVALVEPLGGSCLVTLRRQDSRLTAKVDRGPAWTGGQTVEVSFDMRQCHLFDRASGLALDVRTPDG